MCLELIENLVEPQRRDAHVGKVTITIFYYPYFKQHTIHSNIVNMFKFTTIAAIALLFAGNARYVGTNERLIRVSILAFILE